MLRRTRLGALFTLVALVATAAFATTAMATPSKSSPCDGCHGGGGATISTTLVSTVGGIATYNVSAPGASAIALFNGPTKIGIVTGQITVPVGATYTLYAVTGPTEADGLGSTTVSPVAVVDPPADVTAPVTTSDAAATYVNVAAINLTATDAGSGVATTYYRVDGGTETAGKAIAVSTLGAHTISFWSVDVAGNIETPKTASFTITAITPPTDATAPVTTSDAKPSYVGTATIALTATDAGSGVASTFYTLDAVTETAGTTIVVPTVGTHTITFWSVDVAGNVETPKTANFAITPVIVVPPVDAIAPVTTSDAKASYVGTATIALTATDAGSGVAATFYTLDAGVQTTGTAIAVSTVGTHTVTFWSADKAGNIEAATTATFTITPVIVVPPVESGTITTTISIHAQHGHGHWSHWNRHRGHRSMTVITLFGKLTPSASHQPVSLFVMKPGSTTWELVKVLSTNRSRNRHNSTWDYRLAARTRGVYQFQVKFAGTDSLSASVSKIITVKVH